MCVLIRIFDLGGHLSSGRFTGYDVIKNGGYLITKPVLSPLIFQLFASIIIFFFFSTKISFGKK